jgi:hypothetical protein
MSIRLSLRLQIWEEDRLLNILHPLGVSEAKKELDAPSFTDADIAGLLEMIREYTSKSKTGVFPYWKEGGEVC